MRTRIHLAIRTSIAAALLVTTLLGTPLGRHLPVAKASGCVDSYYNNNGVVGAALRWDHCTGAASVDAYYVNGKGPQSVWYLEAALAVHNGPTLAVADSPYGGSSASTGYKPLGCGVNWDFDAVGAVYSYGYLQSYTGLTQYNLHCY